MGILIGHVYCTRRSSGNINRACVLGMCTVPGEVVGILIGHVYCTRRSGGNINRACVLYQEKWWEY